MKKQRIVVKIGSSSLTNDRGEIDQREIKRSCSVRLLHSVKQVMK